MDIDEALDFVGGYRRWHVTMFILLGFSLFMPVCWQGLIILFSGWEPPHRCTLPEGQSVNESIPMEINQKTGEEMLSKCTMYVNETTSDNITVRVISKCLYGWTYDNEGYYTIIEQWDLVCDRNYLSELSQTLFQVGCLISTLTLSFLIDKYGRKYVHIFAHIANVCIGLVIAFSVNYAMFAATRLLLGIIIIVITNSGIAYIMEMFDSKRRTFAGIGLEFPWVACYLLMTPAAYYIKDWRTFEAVISCSSAIWIVYFWILPESPLWLAAMGRFKEAEVVLHAMARWNGVAVSPETKLLDDNTDSLLENNFLAAELLECYDDLDDSKDPDSLSEKGAVVTFQEVPTLNLKSISDKNFEECSSTKEPNILNNMALMFSDRYLRIVLIMSNLLWFANAVVYYGLILSTPSLAGNRFLNFFIMGVVELPAVIASLYICEKFGRRLSTCVCHMIAGLPLAIVVFVPNETSQGTNLVPLIIVLTMVSKFGITASFSVIIVYTKELFPTNLRGTGGGMGQMLGSFGNIISPFAAYLTKSPTLFWIPNICLAIISTVVGFLVLILPETVRRPLPQTVEDMRMLFRTQVRKTSIVEAIKGKPV